MDILLCGCGGHMGRAVAAAAAAGHRIVAGIDRCTDGSFPFPVYSTPEAATERRTC